MTTSEDNNKAKALPGTIQGWYYHFLFGVPDYFRGQTKYNFLYMAPGYFLGRKPRYDTLHFLFMTPYFFHERSKARHSPFPVHDPWLLPETTIRRRHFRGQPKDGTIISCLGYLTTFGDSPRYGNLISFLWSLTTSCTIQGTALSILVSCLWFMTCSEDRSRGRHFHFL